MFLIRQNKGSESFLWSNTTGSEMTHIFPSHAVSRGVRLKVWSMYLLSPRRKTCSTNSVFEDFLAPKAKIDHSRGAQHREQEEWIHRSHRDRGQRVGPPPNVCHMRRSSLGNGRGRLGFSPPPDPVCFLSSALGLYVPSILLFFLMTHSSSSRARLSSDSTVETRMDTAGAINSCITMVTDSWWWGSTDQVCEACALTSGPTLLR